MKKILILSCVGIALLTGCENDREDRLYDEREKYDDQLTDYFLEEVIKIKVIQVKKNYEIDEVEGYDYSEKEAYKIKAVKQSKSGDEDIIFFTTKKIAEKLKETKDRSVWLYIKPIDYDIYSKTIEDESIDDILNDNVEEIEVGKVFTEYKDMINWKKERAQKIKETQKKYDEVDKEYQSL